MLYDCLAIVDYLTMYLYLVAWTGDPLSSGVRRDGDGQIGK